jgi:hypothetical protein
VANGYSVKEWLLSELPLQSGDIWFFFYYLLYVFGSTCVHLDLVLVVMVIGDLNSLLKIIFFNFVIN